MDLDSLTNQFEGIELVDSVSIGGFMEDKGQIFEIKSDFTENYDTDDIFEVDRIVNEEFDEELKEKFKNPWEKSFSELKLDMVPLSDDVFKKLKEAGNPDRKCPARAKVTLHFNGYYENKRDGPYDSTYMRGEPQTFNIPEGNNVLLDGLQDAVFSMNEGEVSWFWLSYKVMFGELGVPPRIPPKTDLLFEIKLVKFIEIGDENAAELLNDTTANNNFTFEQVEEQVKNVMTNARAMFKMNHISKATEMYSKAVTALELCNMKSDDEQNQQKLYLINLFKNLCVCYNKRKLFKKTCLMTQELERLTDINQDSKIMFAKGKALAGLFDYTRAKVALKTAHSLAPANQDIIKELELLEKNFSEYKKSEQEIAQNAMKLISKGKLANEEKKKKTEVDPNEEAERRSLGIKAELVKFKESKSERLPLPESFSTFELELVKEHAKDLQLFFRRDPFASGEVYYVAKK